MFVTLYLTLFLFFQLVWPPFLLPYFKVPLYLHLCYLRDVPSVGAIVMHSARRMCPISNNDY